MGGTAVAPGDGGGAGRGGDGHPRVPEPRVPGRVRGERRAALERVRCARAETLLLRTDLTVEAVARQCGFADVSHFSHRFRALYDVAPSAYRGVPSALDHAGVRRLARLIQ
ncbi:helix-turn-helix domain-containing protein [Lentzea sp. PSKA42]|uniref:Helix-turn-helix domain-containing protein n=1 Tax=Lentzea indica TaxID=2604800 RepID=A0ABX1FU91_9PSEU|nr:helix-turn-helix domain-containing protein [Lentzea indica]